MHQAPLELREQLVVDAVAVTSVERTLLDVVGTADPALVASAARDALDRGLTTRRRLQRPMQDNDLAAAVLSAVPVR